jgi:nucleotide-binding universal stress UspA family protein
MTMSDTVLCAVDLGWRDGAEPREGAALPELTSAGEEALGAAMREAKLAGAELVLLHALPMSPGAPMSPEGVADALIAREELASVVIDALVEAFTRLQGGEALDIPVLVEDGPAGRAIIEASRRVGAKMIVVGNIGAKGLGDGLLGSVAESVVREAPCSVLVVRSPNGRPAAEDRPM